MNSTPFAESDLETSEAASAEAFAKPLSTQLRIKFFLTGVLLPALCFVLVFFEPSSVTAGTPWQSGRLDHYVTMLLQWPGFGPFLPLVLWSAICLSIWLWRPAASQHVAIRLGIESGVILALQFLILITIVGGLTTFVFAIMIGPAIAGIVFALHSLTTRIRRFTIRHLLILTTVIAILITGIQFVGATDVAEVLVAGFMFAAAASPVLCLLTYTRAGYYVLKQAGGVDRSVSAAARWIAWIAAWLGSWKFAVDIMLVEYSKLPVTNPSCYVSSAAASGHRWLVGRCDDRRGVGPVNDQMKWLKFLEFAVAAAFPRFHRRLRSRYDRVGPPLAKFCGRNVWFADVSYLLLTPLELSARLVRFLAEVPAATVLAIYERPEQ